MSEQSAKPYLVRAICEWCADNGLTPYLNVRVNAETRVPLAYVKNGEIVLKVSASATRQIARLPARWPNLSLMPFRPSMSAKTTTNDRLVRLERAISARSTSRSRR